jgi:hypothetical protein
VGLAGLVLAMASCGGREAELVIAVQRGPFAGGLEVFVCGPAPTDRCKPTAPFDESQASERQIGVFVEDETQVLHVQFQTDSPSVCTKVVVDLARAPKEITASISALGVTTFDCLGQGCEVSPTCDYASRP